MVFHKLVQRYLVPVFQKHYFLIVQQSEHRFKFVSDSVVIIVGNDERERSHTIWIGRNESSFSPIEIDSYVMEHFFKSRISLASAIPEVFLKRLVVFFQRQGERLLTGDKNMLKDLENFSRHRNYEYTLNLLKNQKLAAADHAWQTSNYIEYLRCIEAVGIDNVPGSYKFKYQTARSKTGD